MFFRHRRSSARRGAHDRPRRTGETGRGGRAALLAGLIVLAPPAVAQAPAGPEPILSARLLAPIPADAAIALEPLDDDDANLGVRVRLAVGLAAQARRLADDGPLVLRFVATIESDVRPRGSGLGRPRFGYAARLPPRGGPSSGDAVRGPVRRIVRASLEGRDGGVIWQGEASGVLVGNNETALWNELADRLVGAFGRTLEVRPPPAAR